LGDAVEATSDRPRSPQKLIAVAVVVVLAGCLSVALSLSFDQSPGPLSDLTPGRTYDLGPYRTPANCPQRNWTLGEYLPASCFNGQVLNDIARQVGLERPLDNTGSRGGHLRSQFWVRVGSDAIQVIGPVAASGRIEKIVPNPFAGPASEYRRVPDDGYRKQPFDYMFSYLRELLFLPAGLLAAVIVALFNSRFRSWLLS